MTEKHHENLYSLCRICAAVLTDYTYKTCAYAEDINKIFNVDVRDEIEDINPPLFCLKCYATIQNCLKNGSKPSFRSMTWYPHTGDECATCILRKEKVKGGRPKKRTSKCGRPKKVASTPPPPPPPPRATNVDDIMAT